MHHRDLPRMDAQRPGEAHVAGALDMRGEAGVVVEGREDALQRRLQAIHPRMQQHGETQLVEHRLGRRAAGAEAKVETEIERAVGQPLHTCANGNRRQRQHATSALDQRPDRLAAGRHVADLLGAFRLGQHHTRYARQLAAQGHIGGMFGMVGAIDAHPHAGLGIFAEEGRQMLPRLGLEARFDGILEIDNDDVGTDQQRLGETLGTTARDEQGRADGLGHTNS
ncbi:hypothetical protein D3C81_1447870 [compost metagenome]